MSFDGFDDLPDNIREAIKEMIKNLGQIKPEDIENMVSQLFGEDFLDKIRNIGLEGGSFTFPFSPDMIKKFESVMKNFTEPTQTSPQQFDQVVEEEPYYEFVKLGDGSYQLIVDLPGVTDVRQVRWQVSENALMLNAEGDDIIYKVSIPTSSKIITQDAFAVVKNGTFILPYKM